MRAFVKDCAGPRGGVVTEIADPVVGDADVLVRVEATGLCGTDVSLYNWWPWVVDRYRPALPLVLGHETGGTIVEVGRAVTTAAVGDRVGVVPLVPCGACFHCDRGQSNLCQRRSVLGVDVPGGLAEYVRTPAANVVRLPPETSPELLALWEPFAAVQHALTKAPVAPGDVVAILGAGGMGLLLAISCLARGVARCLVIGLGRDAQRLASAEALGAEAIDADREDVVAVVCSGSRGGGADVVFEAAGEPAAVLQAIELARPGGVVCLVGTPHDPTPIHTGMITGGELQIVGSRAHSPEGVRAAEEFFPALASARPHLSVATFDLAQADDALLAAERGRAFKVVVRA